MACSRRRLLRAVPALGLASIAGCSGSESMRVRSTSITADDRACGGESRAEVTTNEDRTRLDIGGAVPASTPCNDLGIRVYTSQEGEAKHRIGVDIISRGESTDDCRSCDSMASISYTASIVLSLPVSYLRVFHVYGPADPTGIDLAFASWLEPGRSPTGSTGT